MLKFTVAKFYFIDILLFVTLCTRPMYYLILVKNNTELFQKFHTNISCLTSKLHILTFHTNKMNT